MPLTDTSTIILVVALVVVAALLVWLSLSMAAAESAVGRVTRAGLNNKIDPPRIIGVGMLRSNLVAGHALPLPEAAFAQARVRGHVQSQHIGERVRGLQRTEQVGRDDDHASRGCGDLPVVLDVAGFRRPRPRLGQRIRMPGDIGHLRPVVASRKLRRALVGLPLADDVEGHVDRSSTTPKSSASTMSM